MFGKDWRTSEREFDVRIERDVAVPVGDIELVGDVFRPDADGEYPVLLSASPYNTEYQSARITPRRTTAGNAWIESGDPYFYARRGYGHVILNVRGTGKSGGQFRNLGPREVTDIVEAIEWLSERSWCDGTVGMVGISYFGMIQPFVAEREPEPLAALFAPWAATDLYRDWYYHGGIFQHAFTYKWSQQLDNPRCYGWSRANVPEEEFERRIERALADEEIRAHPTFVDALRSPDEGVNPYLVDTVINHLDEPGGYFDERRLEYEHTEVPAYFGADWDHYNIHLAAGFRNFRRWDGPAKVVVAPPVFVDRPLYQLQYESLRWFDHWLKGRDTGITDEPAVRTFLMGAGTWKSGDEWPFPEIKWTPFYLHENGVLSEQDHLPNEGFDTFEDSPFGRGGARYVTPALVERTEVVGPIPLVLYASTTAEEVLWFTTLFKEADGEETELTRGWLRGSQRRRESDATNRWSVERPHDGREPVPADEVVEYHIDINPTGVVIEPGERLGLRVKCADTDETGIESLYDGESSLAHAEVRSAFANGRHLSRQSPSRVSVHHDEAHPSHVSLPITAGNVMGTYRSGGGPSSFDERAPYGKIQMDERPGE